MPKLVLAASSRTVDWMDAPDCRRLGTRTGWTSAAATRPAAALALVFVAIYPVGTLLTEATIRPLVKLAWVAAAMLAAAFPPLGACAMVALVPLVPVLPFTVDGVPYGVVHLIVLSQAIPLLAEHVCTGRRMEVGAVGWLWIVLVALATASVASFYSAYRLVFASPALFASELHDHLRHYVLLPPGKSVENMWVAWSTLVDGLLAYIVVAHAARKLPIRTLTSVFGAVAAVVAAIGVHQGWTGRGLRPMWLLHDPGIIRVNATYSDPNCLAAFLALSIPVLIALATVARGVWRRTWLAALVMAATALVLTAGRMGYLAALFGATALPVLAIWRRMLEPAAERRLRRRLVASLAALLVAVVMLSAVGTLWDVRHRDQRSYLHTLLYTFNLRAPLNETLKGRLTIWRTSALMIEEHPVFGIGVGAMYRQFANYNHRLGGDLEMGLSAHNTFLNVGAEMGVTGLAVWLALLATILGLAFRRARDGTAATADEWLRAGLAAGIAGYCSAMLTGDRSILREDLVVFGAVAALAAAFAPRDWRPASRTRRLALVAVVTIVATWPLRAAAEARQIDLARIRWGFYAAERDVANQSFRWTRGHAAFHIPADSRVISLPVRSVAPFAQHLTVLLDGAVADRIVLADHDWHVTRYRLPSRQAGPRFYRVELQVEPTWVPPRDPRELGVMVGHVGYIQPLSQ